MYVSMLLQHVRFHVVVCVCVCVRARTQVCACKGQMEMSGVSVTQALSCLAESLTEPEACHFD